MRKDLECHTTSWRLKEQLATLRLEKDSLQSQRHAGRFHTRTKANAERLGCHTIGGRFVDYFTSLRGKKDCLQLERDPWSSDRGLGLIVHSGDVWIPLSIFLCELEEKHRPKESRNDHLKAAAESRRDRLDNQKRFCASSLMMQRSPASLLSVLLYSVLRPDAIASQAACSVLDTVKCFSEIAKCRSFLLRLVVASGWSH